MAAVTQILNRLERGDPKAAEDLLPLVYNELRQLAELRMSQEKPGQTLQATALVHEVYVRLVGSNESPITWNSRGHFFGAAAEAMRRILVENARRKGRLKRGGNRQRCDLALAETNERPSVDLLPLDEALTKLAAEHPVHAELIKLWYFAGLTLTDAACALDISRSTADRYWKYARAWLARELRRNT